MIRLINYVNLSKNCSPAPNNIVQFRSSSHLRRAATSQPSNPINQAMKKYVSTSFFLKWRELDHSSSKMNLSVHDLIKWAFNDFALNSRRSGEEQIIG